MPADNLPEIDHVKWFLVLAVGTVAGVIIAYAYKQTLGAYLDNWVANMIQRQGLVATTTASPVLPVTPAPAAAGTMAAPMVMPQVVVG